MRRIMRYSCLLAVVALAWSVAPGTSVAMSRGAVVGSFDHARGIGRDVAQRANRFGGRPDLPGRGLGSDRRNAAFDLVTSIYERLGLDRDFVRPPRPSPH